jgi:hypothetical protein
LDQYCCVIYFASYKLINDFTVKNLIAYREQGNGIFIVTDHMPRNYSSLQDAVANSFEAEFFGGGGNRLITNFGAYFSGDYNRSPVNVGYIRRTYGNHPLWKNLRDDEYIHAGGSESEVKVTTYPLPSRTIREFGIGTCGIRGTMTADDKLRNHTWNAQQEHTSDVYQNKGCATFLTSHIREAPYVTQTYGATCCSKNQSNLATKTSSI